MGKLDVAYATRKRVRKMGRKVSFDEKKEIVQWTLDHQRNYQAAAEKYNVSYQRVYSWVHKYSNSQDWQALRDNRGRNKGKEASSEVERLRQRVRELEREKREREVEINFAKKLIEIHNRGGATTGRYQAIQEMSNEGYSITELVIAAGISR